MRLINLIPCLLLVVILMSCNNTKTTKENMPIVKTTIVTSAANKTSLQFPGKVKASNDINLAFRVSGMIQKMYVDNGSYVRKGQLLCELDPTDYQIQVDATQAEYMQVKAQAERVISLYKDSVTTVDNYDKAVYGLQQITAKYDNAKDQLEYTRLYAPFNGYIQKRLFNPHETISAGIPVLSMISEGAPEVEINLPAADYIRRDLFTAYRCSFDVYPNEEYTLSLINVTPKANANQLYTMRLQLSINSDQPLPSPGMNTMVTIECNSDETNNMIVPSSAVLKNKVYIYDSQSQTIHQCEVEIQRLLSNGTCVVTSPTLEINDVIVTTGVRFLNDGDKVQLLSTTSETNIGGLL